jgi:glycosyltransferase involved in cell wall biosynthesis
VTLFNPLPPRRFDLVHAFNRIPVGFTPFIIGFESHLPRAFGREASAMFRAMSGLLASRRCRRIVAMSRYAQRQFERQHRAMPWWDGLQAKFEIRYPSLPMPKLADGPDLTDGGVVRLLFVGAHFARKGGCVAVRVAELAHRRGLPIAVDIVSRFQVGPISWVDPTRVEFFDLERRLLAALPNLTNHGALANDAVLSLMANAHFVLLPTFSDTFGLSAVEAMASATPVIATDQGALPEFIEDGRNGILLSLETDAMGDWVHGGRQDRGTARYEALFRDEINRMAEEALGRIETLIGSPAYAAMRAGARATAERLFDSARADAYWDNLYHEAAAGLA